MIIGVGDGQFSQTILVQIGPNKQGQSWYSFAPKMDPIMVKKKQLIEIHFLYFSLKKITVTRD